MLTYRKVAGIKTCQSPTTFGGYGTASFTLMLHVPDASRFVFKNSGVDVPVLKSQSDTSLVVDMSSPPPVDICLCPNGSSLETLFCSAPPELGLEMVEMVRHTTDLSYAKSRIAVATILSVLGERLPSLQPITMGILMSMTDETVVSISFIHLKLFCGSSIV